MNAKYNEGRFFEEVELGHYVQRENIYDRHEWQRIDSAGYSLPHREN